MHIDMETASELDLTKVGVYRYAEHPSTKILVMWIDDYEWLPGRALPPALFVHLGRGRQLASWNSTFERVMWNVTGRRLYGFPATTIAQWRNPQAVAMAMNMPAGLDAAAKALRLTVEKDAVGAKLMRKMSTGAPGDIDRLSAYCRQDVVVETAVDAKVASSGWNEREVFEVSEEVNDRGTLIDVEFVELAARAVEEYQLEQLEQCTRQYGVSPTNVPQMGARLRALGVALPDLRAETLDALVPLGDLMPAEAQDLIRYRQLVASSSTKKFASMLRSVCSDGRIRGTFQYHGAGQTGRWSGRIYQPHNLPRPTMKLPDTIAAMETLRREKTWRALGPSPLDVLMNCIRPSIISPSGVLTAGDESAIEARVLPWLADCQAPLEVFRDGGDIYMHAASSIYHRAVTDKEDPARQIGKVATLALGFGGGKGSFATMGANYGVVVPPAEADQIKVAWREANPEIPALWAVLDTMAFEATLRVVPCAGASANAANFTKIDPEVFARVKANVIALGIRFAHNGYALICRLPSGRCIWYPEAHIEYMLAKTLFRIFMEAGDSEPEARRRAMRFQLVYKRPGGAGMTREHTYGGKLAENITQAVARDVLAHAMVRARSAPIVLHVHDELVAEGDHYEQLHEALTTVPRWAPGLPLAAEVKLLHRYGK